MKEGENVQLGVIAGSYTEVKGKLKPGHEKWLLWKAKRPTTVSFFRKGARQYSNASMRVSFGPE